ncbi:MAG TPA: polysaccharide biosynthesis protein [Solirubrobacter sp.]|jgi:UDP-glucose 4-epimerase|nr:polysaccharide biosynthesis protein [Solirubrobacter sp.]
MPTLDDAVVLITGGTGSLGQTLTRRLLRGDLGRPRRIIVFSRDEAKQYAMKTTWKSAREATDDIIYHNFDQLLEFRIGDVRDYASVLDAVSRSDVVFHAAAMKQVPTCEYFPAQATATNVIGADNVVRAVRHSERPHTVVGVSTDKACKPVNVMGMTKAIQERIIIEGNLDNDRCRLIGVRYGNVLESRGSVIPLFKHQIAAGGPVTITDPAMTRFLLSLESAVDTIFEAFRDARRGEIYVPKVPSARIVDVAAAMIGDRDIATIITGIRPGEKLHEILISDEEALRTVDRGSHFALQPMLPDFDIDDAPRPLAGEYSSAVPIVTGEELRALIAVGEFVDVALR